mgnify:CR=1 FL=1
MSDDIKNRTDQLKDEIYGAIDTISAALESGEQKAQLDAGKLIDPLIEKYQQVFNDIPGAERDMFDRTVGRIMTDMRRLAAGLATQRTGQKAVKAVDAGPQPFILTRAPSPFLTRTTASAPAPRRVKKYSIGGDIEAWCGKCKELTGHSILVIEGDEPKQVLCGICRSQHNYRTESARPTDKPATGSTASNNKVSGRTSDADKQRSEKNKLADELAAAVDVKLFNPRDTFKSGQIISHPLYGRGKVESITRGSVLIRFVEGLRPLSRS